MPVLELDPAIDTAVPGFTRRRIWAAPAVRSHSLVALTLTKLYLAPPTATLHPELAAKIQNGADIESALGAHATVVELTRITRLKYDLVSNTLAIELGVRGSRVVLEFASHEAADDVYTKLWRRLGDRFELQQARKSGWDLARFPIAVMAGVLVMTSSFAILGNAASDIDRGNMFWQFFTGFDWRIVCGLGGGTLAILQIWLYRRLTQPPALLELAVRDD